MKKVLFFACALFAGMSGMVPFFGAAGGVMAPILAGSIGVGLTIDNCHCEKIKEKNGEFATTKKDKNLLHGIGIKNVRKVVSDLNGQIDISYTDDTFHVGILLPNYE
jgi:hypothetical protein